jgi:hypothetical protein
MLHACFATEQDLSRLGRFLDSAENGHLFARPEFLAYHGEKFQTRFILIKKTDEWVGVVPVAALDGGTAWVSHPGASFGGPVLASLRHFDFITEALQAVETLAKAEGCRELRLAPPPGFYQAQNSDLLAGALEGNGYQPVKKEITQAVPVSGDLEKQFASPARKNIKKADRSSLGVEWLSLQDQSVLSQFYALLEDNRKRHGSVPTHTPEELALLERNLGAAVRLAGAYREGRAAAFSLCFVLNPRGWMVFYNCQDYGQQELRPLELTVYHVLQAAAAAGGQWVDFGTSTLGIEKPLPNLFRYKEKFGALSFRREKYVKELKG